MKAVLRTRIFGDVYLLDALQRRLGILDDLVAAFGSDIGRDIMALAFAYTIQPVALMHMEEVYQCVMSGLSQNKSGAEIVNGALSNLLKDNNQKLR